MVNSRDKGKRGEREVAKIYRDHGWSKARRGQQFSGSPESPDVVGGPEGFHTEVKFTEVTKLYDWLEQARADKYESEAPLIVHRKKGKEWLAILPLEDLLKLITSDLGNDL